MAITTLDPPDKVEIEGNGAANDEKILEKQRPSSYPDCPNPLLVGKLISDPDDSRCWVAEHNTHKGDVLAVKFPADEWELEMIKYAAAHDILVPKPHYSCGVVDEGSNSCGLAMVTERVPGKTLFEVWDTLGEAEKFSIKDQLRAQIARMRTCTQDTIGRLTTLPLHAVYRFDGVGYCGPFSTEKKFDQWRRGRLSFGCISSFKWKIKLSRYRRKSSGKFVLTHSNLSPRKIIVQGSTITGIVGWEDSGFFPEHIECAVAMARFGEEIEWWASVLQDVLEPCAKEMVDFTKAVRRGRRTPLGQGFGGLWFVLPLTCCFILTCCCCGFCYREDSRSIRAEEKRHRHASETFKDSANTEI